MMPSRSYAHLFRERVAATPTTTAFLVPSYHEPEEWRSLTWESAATLVNQLAAGLLALGVSHGDRVALVCGTRIEWVLSDLALATIGAVTTTVYPSTNLTDEKYILLDAGAQLVVAENWAQVTKLRTDPELDSRTKAIVLIDDDRPGDSPADDRILSYANLLSLGDTQLRSQPECVNAALDAVKPSDLSTLIYTSGTTGTPKGVELTHSAWTFEAAAVKQLDFVYPDDRLYLWLPLAHVFGRDLLSVQLAVGFESVVDGRVNRIVAGVGETAPTLLVGVPRIFEKVRAAVMTMYPKRGLKGRISHWAFAVGRDSRESRLAGKRMSPTLALRYFLADKLVFRKLRAKLGGRMRLMVSGSAKLSPQVQEWFYSAGLVLIEGYGLTETSAIACVDDNLHPHFGTVGKPLPGVDIRIAADGEILVRGDNVARGYHNLPAANAESFPDGWFHTGDIGEFTPEGTLRITDRKKDLLKTSNGKYVAPQKVETAIMANTPYAAQAVVIGEGHPYCAALIVLDRDPLAAWAKRRGKADLGFTELSTLPEIRNSIDRCIRRANRKLESWETIKKYVILERELTLESDELTPSLKVRRAQVLSHFADAVNAIYADPSPIPFVSDRDK
ncbi:MAG: long-chain fatty acid--CoA ligase [Propionibacteriaceae bacterium]|nr:long-chain fatty acid--CoA ligase [Propionibacteriaceae bacterium]